MHAAPLDWQFRGTNPEGQEALVSMIDKVRKGIQQYAEKLKNDAKQLLGDNGLDAIELLKQQHRDVEQLFVMLEERYGPGRPTRFAELADTIALHAEIEEKIFYPATKQARTKKLLLEAVEEHLSVKRVLTDMLQADPGDESFGAKLKVLREQIEHHVKEEEEELFPAVQKLLDKQRLLEIGQQMEAMVAELQETGMRNRVAAQTDYPAPI
jgi:hypothetical protein